MLGKTPNNINYYKKSRWEYAAVWWQLNQTKAGLGCRGHTFPHQPADIKELSNQLKPIARLSRWVCSVHPVLMQPPVVSLNHTRRLWISQGYPCISTLFLSRGESAFPYSRPSGGFLYSGTLCILLTSCFVEHCNIASEESFAFHPT